MTQTLLKRAGYSIVSFLSQPFQVVIDQSFIEFFGSCWLKVRCYPANTKINFGHMKQVFDRNVENPFIRATSECFVSAFNCLQNVQKVIADLMRKRETRREPFPESVHNAASDLVQINRFPVHQLIKDTIMRSDDELLLRLFDADIDFESPMERISASCHALAD